MNNNENFTIKMKKEIIVNFLKANNNSGFSQGELARNLMSDLCYTSEASARVSIGNLMRSLQDDGSVHFVKRKPKHGPIMSRIWYLKEDGRIQEVPSENQEE